MLQSNNLQYTYIYIYIYILYKIIVSCVAIKEQMPVLLRTAQQRDYRGAIQVVARSHRKVTIGLKKKLIIMMRWVARADPGRQSDQETLLYSIAQSRNPYSTVEWLNCRVTALLQ